MKNSNAKEAQRFLLSYLALTPIKKRDLLCNMIAICAGKSAINQKEADFILAMLDEATEGLKNGVV